ncbi:MAG: valine--tRNA ligase [Planctomycetes bacterium]|nr:valine--tRNA ligase [Planctomycetota bacterium]MCB9903701.1 valine--tRNA ligase [Planctomycetota bacterium]
MELPTRYTPADHEQPLYQAWEDAGCFQPKPDPTGANRRYTVMIPPPNVTGALHMGHALNGTVQDIVIRHRRMQGYETLWVPGTDHAGIATQAVVEKKLFQEEGKKREEMGREAFLEKVWEWKEEYGSRILEQFRRLGSSCDWTRTRFTMEEHMSRAVRESFVRLWKKGLIYRGMRLVNWDCVLQTAISDDEIEYASRKGKLWYIKYPLEAAPGEFVTVATTRPETMLGDTGVAVHPDDPRYGKLVGTNCILPFQDRPIPIVADESVDPEFGTGAVKITPGHDPADYERGARHKLPTISILEKDGRLNEFGAPFAGLSREAARKGVVEGLEELGLLEKVEEITHNVSLSDRSKSPVEPMISEQWFVKMEPLARPAIAAAKSGRLQFRPERWSKVYLNWLENVHDWCISRQLWWGHRIPVWYDEDGVGIASVTDLEIGSKHPETGKPIVGQDEDVLDTWASSWLWPFATIGWPDKTEDLSRYYPTQFLSTASEIIYLWVARMVMAGYEFMDDLPEDQRCPFDTVNIHATVLDAKGKRMSKSAGNGIDPIDMIEQYGADAVRYSLILLTKEGQDTKLAPDKFEQGWRFGNKVWNAARFVLMNLAGETQAGDSSDAARLEDRWILARLAETIERVTADLEAYSFNDAAMALYRFVWNDFCDWYLELAKPRFTSADDPTGPAARRILARVLGDVLALLHPFTPYMTEVLHKALREALGDTDPDYLMTSAWPTGAGLVADQQAVTEMSLIQDTVQAVRQMRVLTGVSERKPLSALLVAPREHERAALLEHAPSVRALALLEGYEVAETGERPDNSAAAVAGGVQIFVQLGEDVDFDALKSQLEKRAEKLEKGIAQCAGKLSNDRFVQNADPDVVEAERTRMSELELELTMLRENLAGF